MNSENQGSIWSKILKITITVLTAIATALGLQACDTRTQEQKETLQKLLERLNEDYPEAKVVGHRNLPGVKKDCPCFEV